MKFLTSSSSSASSTITTTTSNSFDANVHNSRNTPAGCIAGMFRRLLCLNNLPTHPSDNFKDSVQYSTVFVDLDKPQCSSGKADEGVESSATRSIVARLMGLESFPQIDFSATQKSPNSIERSRSMNSVDLMNQVVSIQGRHRRARSFRETPTFVELQDEDFFILSFENGGKIGKSRAETGKDEMESGQKSRMKQSSIREESCKPKNGKGRESVYEKNKENLNTTKNAAASNGSMERAINSRKGASREMARDDDVEVKDSRKNVLRPTKASCKNALVGKEVVKVAKPQIHESLGRSRRMKKRKDDCLPVKKIETETDSENSSPNSVLDIMEIPGDPEVTSSPGAEELSRLTNSKSRRTLTEELENYRKLNHQCSNNDSDWTSNSASCKSTIPEGKNGGHELRKFDQGSRSCVHIWGEICEFAGRDTIQSTWFQNKEIHKFEEYEEIIGEFQSQILDELLREVVALLVGKLGAINNFDL